MFHISITFFSVIVNLAFFASCDTLIQPGPADFYSIENTELDEPNKGEWIVDLEKLSGKFEETDVMSSLAVLPLPVTEQKSVYFYLYTKKNPTVPHELKINSQQGLRVSYFNGSKPTVFVTHGWINTANSASCTRLRDAYLAGADDINVIVVDWSYYALSLYNWSVENLNPVGKVIAKMINWLQSVGHLRLNLTTLVGHSLGAHLMGIVGRNTVGTVNQIFGLDPASVLFEKGSTVPRISRDCARHVQIIHTNGNQVGLLEPLGHSDFYVNGGKNQPGCPLDSFSLGYCSHTRAFEYFAESLNSPIGFKALKCKSGQNPYNGECTGEVVIMGGRSNTINYTGMYYTKTGASSPYALKLVFKRPRSKVNAIPLKTSVKTIEPEVFA